MDYNGETEHSSIESKIDQIEDDIEAIEADEVVLSTGLISVPSLVVLQFSHPGCPTKAGKGNPRTGLFSILGKQELPVPIRQIAKNLESERGVEIVRH